MIHGADSVIHKALEHLDDLAGIFVLQILEPLLEKIQGSLAGLFPRTTMKLSWPRWFNQEVLLLTGSVMGILSVFFLLFDSYAGVASILVAGFTLLNLCLVHATLPSKCPIRKRPDNSLKNDGDDIETFEIVTTGSPHVQPSWIHHLRQKRQLSFYVTLAESIFHIVKCIVLLSRVERTNNLHLIRYVALFSSLILESVNVYQDIVDNAVGNSCNMSVDSFLSMKLRSKKGGNSFRLAWLGMATGFYLASSFQFLGLLMMMLALPVSYESARVKTRVVVLYFNGGTKKFGHQVLSIFSRAKSLCSRLVVGLPGKKTADDCLNVMASHCVDEVIVEAPLRLDLFFLDKQGIDFCVMVPGDKLYVTDEVVIARRVLVIDDTNASLLLPKLDHTN